MTSPTSALLRFVGGLPGFVRHRITMDDARRIVGERFAAREEMFLDSVATCVYRRPSSPYRALLELAGCELGDLRDSVLRNGIEQTLRRLCDEGVYVSFEEFKGRAPLVRHGRHIDASPAAFANPPVGGAMRSFSGGSTGPATQTARSLSHLADESPGRALGLAAAGVFGVPAASWLPRLPAVTAITCMIADARAGHRYERWFAPPGAFDRWAALGYRLATELIRAGTALGGLPIPRPETEDHERPLRVARWAQERARLSGAAVVRTGVSYAMRAALTAAEEGMDLTGVTFYGSGEPPTQSKVAVIRASGAEYVPNYAMSEFGHLGLGCGRPTSTNDNHLMRHKYAFVQRPRLDPLGQATVDALLVTTLVTTTPVFALNVESDDYGVVESRSCGCDLGGAGLDDHIRDIASFSKLTGEGVTLVGTGLVALLEETLPRRFGGTPLDYQLVEEEDDEGFTKLILVVSPRVHIREESEVIRTLLDGLGPTRHAVELRHIWTLARTISIRRAEPLRTGRGKQLSLVKLGGVGRSRPGRGSVPGS